MAQFDKLKVLNTLLETGMVPVFHHHDTATACEVLKACYNGGVRMFEFTNRGDFAHETFTALVRYARSEAPEMILGAGSIIDASSAALYIQNGANFIVGPCFDEATARLCNRRAIPYIPGCETVSEIMKALEMGCHLIKIFPAGCIGGPAFVKSVQGPLPWVRFIATGGMEPEKEELHRWFEAGVSCVGLGSQLFPLARINGQEWKWITDKCRSTLDIIHTCRSQ